MATKEESTMPRVVPSTVVAVIDKLFPMAASQKDEEGARFAFGRRSRNEVTAIVDLVEQVPGELLLSDPSDYADFSIALSAVKGGMKTWEIRDDEVEYVRRLSNLNPISIIRRLLSKCPDESLGHSPSSLRFINGEDYRDSILLDISGANQALSNGEWKAATVLSGAAIEALLLWALLNKSQAEIQTAVGAVFPKGISGPLEKWSLHEMLEVARELNVILSETHAQINLTKNFRNLIHPGRVVRTGQRCDRSTALTAMAALEAVIRDLTP
jgi:hypothetical protein